MFEFDVLITAIFFDVASQHQKKLGGGWQGFALHPKTGKQLNATETETSCVYVS
jgi:hypothetical protein